MSKRAFVAERYEGLLGEPICPVKLEKIIDEEPFDSDIESEYVPYHDDEPGYYDKTGSLEGRSSTSTKSKQKSQSTTSQKAVRVKCQTTLNAPVIAINNNGQGSVTLGCVTVVLPSALDVPAEGGVEPL